MTTSPMNSDQIRAWLTLEGWVPTEETDKRWPGMQRDNLGAWAEDEEGSGTVCYSESGLAEGRVFCTWDEMPEDVCLRLYEWASKDTK